MGEFNDRELMLTIRVAALRATVEFLVDEVRRLGGLQGAGAAGDPIHEEDLADIPVAQRENARLVARALHYRLVGAA